MFYVGKIVIKKKRKKICYDVGSNTLELMCKMICDFISEKEFVDIVIKIRQGD